MFPQPQVPDYREGLNELLLATVPENAHVVVETGCGEGRLGERLKALVPGRTVIGVEIDPVAAAMARTRLDEVHVHDLTTGPPPIAPASADAILFGDVLEHLVDPEKVLVEARALLAPGGRVIASIPNIAHHSMLGPLLRADFMYQPQGLLDATHLRFFTYATIWKLFLDAGYVPRIAQVAESPVDDATHRAITPALTHFRVDPERARRHLSAYQYIVEAVPEPPRPAGWAAPLTFAVMVNDQAQLNSNLLRSPVLAPGNPHQLLELRDCSSAADGLRDALDQSAHDIVVLVQQDMYLPRGWDHAFRASWDQAVSQFGPIGIAGVFGLRYRSPSEPTDVGRVIDRDRLLDVHIGLAAEVDALDEVVLALPGDTPLEPDPELGFHLYGSDLALQARQRGLPVVVLDALCQHNSLTVRVGPDFHVSRDHLLTKWESQRPLRSNMGPLDTMEPRPLPVPWHIELQRSARRAQRKLDRRTKRLALAKEELRHVRAQLATTRRQLAASQRRVEQLERRPLAKVEGLARRLVGRT